MKKLTTPSSNFSVLEKEREREQSYFFKYGEENNSIEINLFAGRLEISARKRTSL